MLEGKKVDLDLLNDEQFWHYIRLNGIHYEGDRREPEDLDGNPDNVAFWMTLRMRFLDEHAKGKFAHKADRLLISCLKLGIRIDNLLASSVLHGGLRQHLINIFSKGLDKY